LPGEPEENHKIPQLG